MIGKEHKGPSNFFNLKIAKTLVLLSIFMALVSCRVAHPGYRFSLPESRTDFDVAWKSTLGATLLSHKSIVIEDKESGYFQTSWDIHKVGVLIGAPVKRSRLIGRVVNRAPFRLDLDVEQEAFSLELGRWVSDPPDKKRFAEAIDRVRARLRF